MLLPPLLGSLGVVQAILLPGLCLSTCIKTWNWPQRIFLAPPLSLLVNYYLVWSLVGLGLYNQITMLAIAALEVSWIAWRATIPLHSTAYPELDKWSDTLLLLIGVGALTKYAQAWTRNLGDIFQMWDAIVSWNAWGIAWSQGKIPISDLYPHALPVSFSLPYVFMGNSEIEAFAKASMGIMFLMAIAALLELGFRRKEYRSLSWILAFVYPSVQAKFLQSHWNSGYADVPLALTLLFGFYAYTLVEKKKDRFFLGLMAGAAPLVKQPGLLFAAISPLIHGGLAPLLGFMRSEGRKNWQAAIGEYAPIILGAILAAAPWYIYISTEILAGRSGNNTSSLATLVSGGLLDRWGHTWQLLSHFASPLYLSAYFALALLGSVTSVVARRWWLLLGLPYFLIWGTLFAYDIRNVSMALFPMALASSAGIVFLWEKSAAMISRLAPRFTGIRLRLRAGALGKSILAVTLLMMAPALKRPISHWQQAGSVQAWEKEQKLALGDSPQANKIFAELMNCVADDKISFLTNFWWAGVIPQLQSKLKSVGCETIQAAAARSDLSYVYLYEPTCPLATPEGSALYDQNGIKIVRLSKRLPARCGEE